MNARWHWHRRRELEAHAGSAAECQARQARRLEALEERLRTLAVVMAVATAARDEAPVAAALWELAGAGRIEGPDGLYVKDPDQ